jgi:hypothetical protein
MPTSVYVSVFSTSFMHYPRAASSRKASQADPLRTFMLIITHALVIGPTAEPDSSVCKASISRR